MSEGAPVNTGAVAAPTAWPSPERAAEAVQRMQIKLHRWAGEDSSRRFDDLFNLVHDPAFLLVAFIRVAASTGARTAGIDGATVARIRSGIGVRALLEQLRAALRTGLFEPAEVRRVEIPKANGKTRNLTIPARAGSLRVPWEFRAGAFLSYHWLSVYAPAGPGKADASRSRSTPAPPPRPVPGWSARPARRSPQSCSPCCAASPAGH